MADAAPPAPPPKVHPGERLANFFDNLFKTIIAIATLGSSLTFSKIVQTPVVPWVDYGYSKVSIQYFLCNAFLFFILDLGITSFAASALTLYRPQAVDWFGIEDSRRRRVVMWYAACVSGVLFGLLIIAFVFVALVVVAYSGPAGYCALAAVAGFGALGFGTILWQSPMFRSSIGSERDTISTDMRIYGYTDEKVDRYTKPVKVRQDVENTGNRLPSQGYINDRRQDDGYALPRRQDSGYGGGMADDGYDSEKQMAADGRYVDERLSWGSATVPHVPVTAADHYYEERRSSRAKRLSAPATKYYEYEDERQI